MNDATTSPPAPAQAPSGLSYKFQRLREKIRQAVASGELVGKLPGERTLAKRFHVNAKTLSKALTDLAAEGILDRSIGRGTYVKGHGPTKASAKRWLLVCDPDQTTWDVVRLVQTDHPETDIVSDVSSLRPSFLNQFNAVIDLAAATPDAFLRDLVVRNIPVVVVGKEPKTYSTHAVLFDVPLAASHLGRELLLGGHRRLAAVAPRQSTALADALRKCAARYAQEAHIDICFPADVSEMIDSGVTAFVCQSVELAALAKQQLDELGVAVPHRISLAAVGPISDETPVSGYFVQRTEKAKAIAHLLADGQISRPTTLWLAGHYLDRGTTSPLTTRGSESDLRYDSESA
jgi:Bacterial regulatory proteins, gntR family/Periplasmic binding protein-like domain